MPLLANIANLNLEEHFVNKINNIKRTTDTEGYHYLHLLNSVVSLVSNNVNSISFMSKYENQFEILLSLNPEYQSVIFSKLMKLKVKINFLQKLNNENILEINIKIQALENIFNSLNDNYQL